MSITGSHARSVLVVDDDAIFHFLMKKMLMRQGVMPDFIQTAHNGKEALDKLTEFQFTGIPFPDLILLDLNMPMMGGFEFLEAFNKLPVDDQPDITIIIISSSLNNRDEQRALQLGASKYLVKPVSETDLRQIIR